jgi:2-polyprenyl-3-methyl-5-hydroxy-6-metoxy-1,4-benzoquinol methylase
VSREDSRRWDEKHAAAIAARECGEGEGEPSVLEAAAAFLPPPPGRALDVACGRGGGSLALARRGYLVTGVDASLVGLVDLRRAAETEGLARSVRTLVADLEEGLPAGLGEFEVVLCRHFHQPSLWPALRAALAPGGVVVFETLTRLNEGTGVTAPSARYLVVPGEILGAAEGLEVLLHDEALHEGRHVARLVARRPNAGSPAVPSTLSR